MKRILALALLALMCVAMLVGCPSTDGLQSAKEYLDTIMLAKAESTPADYEVLNRVVIGQTNVYTITWSVNVTEGVAIVVDGDKVTVDVNERAEAEIPYVLTATLKDANGNTVTASYNRRVPIFQELTWAQFTATEDDQPVVIRGTITGIVNTSTKHELYLEDEDGGYYVYNLPEDEMDDLAVGLDVRVSGIRDTYYGVNQVIEASVEVMNAEPNPVTPTDITALVNSATNFKDAALLALQSKLVKITNVTVLGQDPSDATYFNFSVGDPVGAKKSYVRISSSACMLTSAEQTTFKNNVEDNLGMGATVTGVVSIYNNAVYIIPVDVNAFAEFATVDRTPAQQVEFEKTLMDSIGTITEGGSVALPTAGKIYEDVTITWAISGESYGFSLNGNKLVIPVLPDEDKTITLVATIANGDETATREFTVKIAAAPRYVPDTVTAPAANEKTTSYADAVKYKFVIRQFQTKQTLYLADFENGKLNVTTDYTKAADVGLEPVEGKSGEYYLYYYVGEARNYITVSVVDNKATLGTSRYAGSNTYTYDSTYDTLKTVVTIKDKDNNDKQETYWLGTYNKNKDYIGISQASYLTATSYNTTNFPAHFATIVDTSSKTDAEKVAKEKADLSITTKFSGTTEYTLPGFGGLYVQVVITWAVDPADTTGAVVIEDGVMKIAPQPDAATVKVTATIKHGDVTDTKEFNVQVDKMGPISIGDALELPDNSNVIVMGEVTKVNYNWSSSANNMSVTITGLDGKSIYIYKLATKVELGDFIIVTGKMATYNGRQIAAGATAEIVGKDAISLEEANAAADNTQVVVKGTVTNIKSAWNAQYGNMELTITDENGDTLFLYRLATKVELGDVIVVSGKMATYKGARQMAQGCTAVIVAQPAQEMTIEEALAAADGTKVQVTGTVQSIDTPWNEGYGNITVTITDGEGNTLQLYRLATNVAEGDVITVTGRMDTYSGNRQMAQGATAVIVPPAAE